MPLDRAFGCWEMCPLTSSWPVCSPYLTDVVGSHLYPLSADEIRATVHCSAISLSHCWWRPLHSSLIKSLSLFYPGWRVRVQDHGGSHNPSGTKIANNFQVIIKDIEKCHFRRPCCTLIASLQKSFYQINMEREIESKSGGSSIVKLRNRNPVVTC